MQETTKESTTTRDLESNKDGPQAQELETADTPSDRSRDDHVDAKALESHPAEASRVHEKVSYSRRDVYVTDER